MWSPKRKMCFIQHVCFKTAQKYILVCSDMGGAKTKKNVLYVPRLFFFFFAWLFSLPVFTHRFVPSCLGPAEKQFKEQMDNLSMKETFDLDDFAKIIEVKEVFGSVRIRW